MVGNSRRLTIAISMTLLDVAVAFRYGAEIWTAWSGIGWVRLLILALGALLASSLANIWVQTGRGLGRAVMNAHPASAPREVEIHRERQGEGDV